MCVTHNHFSCFLENICKFPICKALRAYESTAATGIGPFPHMHCMFVTNNTYPHLVLLDYKSLTCKLAVIFKEDILG